MAKNWKVGEAVQAIKSGDVEATLDIGRRFPLFAVLAAQVNEPAMKLLDCVPDYVTARKIESVLKGEAQEAGDEGGDDEVAEEKPTKAKSEKADSKDNADVLDSKTPKELYEICQELGIKVKPKQPAEIYIKAIKKHQQEEAKKAKKAAKTAPVADSDDEWDDEEPAEKPSKKSAKDEDDEWDI